MVKFDFNPASIEFKAALDIIEQGYVAAVAGITQEINRKKAALYDYNRDVELGKPPIEERDDGQLLWSQDELLEVTIAEAEQALQSLRRAYAIAIYHQWERSALRWTGKKSAPHDDLMRLVVNAGYPVETHLGAVRDLANLLKHANNRWGKDLLISWPDVFPKDAIERAKKGWAVNWYDEVSLSGEHIVEMLLTVRASGPQYIPFGQ